MKRFRIKVICHNCDEDYTVSRNSNHINDDMITTRCPFCDCSGLAVFERVCIDWDWYGMGAVDMLVLEAKGRLRSCIDLSKTMKSIPKEIKS
ncbi:hypothetical protein N9137_02265 [Pseudomonadales bacterium]|nr:hypothetical protein [Pseudomonadales bacterium]